MAKLEKKSFTRPVNEDLFESFFSTEEERTGPVEAKSKTMIPLSHIDPFPNHPFHVTNDASMQELVESVRERGILDPVLVRKVGTRYQLISGHRRKMAAELCGLNEIPANIVEMSDDEATIAMVEANFHRQKLLPSEKAFSYRMRNDAMKHQGKKIVNDTDTADSIPNHTAAVLAASSEDSASQIKRYIRLTYLQKELLDMVDQERIGLIPGVELSFMPSDDQIALIRVIKMLNRFPNMKEATGLKNMSISSDHNLTDEEIITVFLSKSTHTSKQVSVSYKELSRYIPENIPQSEYERYIFKALDYYREHAE